MSEKRKPKYLSANWMELYDADRKRVYFAHRKTKESVWKRPEEKIKQDIAENGVHKSQKIAQKKEPKDIWVERQDPETGKVFYFNPKQKKTSWHRPENVLSHDAHKLSTNNGQWVEKIDPRTGRPFFYNPVLQMTSWDNPNAPQQEVSARSGVSKRLSQMANRVSMGITTLAAAGKSSRSQTNRNSASFTLDKPALPVNKNSARKSARLVDIDTNTDLFKNLREMRNQKPLSQRINQPTEQTAEDFLNINLQEEMDKLDLMYETKDFLTYANNHFNKKNKNLFSKKNLNMRIVTSYQKKLIKQPLHVFHDKTLSNDAILAFKFLQTYIGSRKKGKNDTKYAQLFIKMGIQTNNTFQAELYAQLIKQSTNNTNDEIIENVLELFALSCGCFPPNDEIEPYVKSHLRAHIEESRTERIKNLALYAILRLERYKDRLHFPSLQEIASTRAITPVELTIELISTDPISIQIDAWTTVKDIKDRIQGSFSIKDGSPFSLFEVSNLDEDRHLSDDDIVLDVLGYWEDNGGDFQCMYKMRFYFDINEEDVASIELAYLQTVFEVIDQRYPCEEIDAIRLAALEAQEKFGDYNGTDVFGDQLGAYIPHRFYDPETADDMKQAIYGEYQSMAGTDKLQCMVTYMNYVKQWQFYGCAYYFAEPLQLKILGKDFPKRVLLAINAKAVMVVDHETKNVIVEYPYSEIVTWGHSEAHFVIVVGNLVLSTKMFFATIDGSDMNQLVDAYVNKLMEAQTEEERDQMLMKQLAEGN